MLFRSRNIKCFLKWVVINKSELMSHETKFHDPFHKNNKKCLALQLSKTVLSGHIFKIHDLNWYTRSEERRVG